MAALLEPDPYSSTLTSKTQSLRVPLGPTTTTRSKLEARSSKLESIKGDIDRQTLLNKLRGQDIRFRSEAHGSRPLKDVQAIAGGGVESGIPSSSSSSSLFPSRPSADLYPSPLFFPTEERYARST
ncbi:hypothetical protein BDN70DRAFT_926867 [Pholiota conissans]|uniref:Uncharacterized protein n=1 Tax=Pholiota conissans TaxID=109636 RepID=A0A9P5ZDC3_9AGAR|nr:hypothetical protein BDN70DRAFT_926867 [Pholiota conissans]